MLTSILHSAQTFYQAGHDFYNNVKLQVTEDIEQNKSDLEDFPLFEEGIRPSIYRRINLRDHVNIEPMVNQARFSKHTAILGLTATAFGILGAAFSQKSRSLYVCLTASGVAITYLANYIRRSQTSELNRLGKIIKEQFKSLNKNEIALLKKDQENASLVAQVHELLERNQRLNQRRAEDPGQRLVEEYDMAEQEPVKNDQIVYFDD